MEGANGHIDKGSVFLKAEEAAEIHKGKQPHPIGTKKVWGTREYMKTATGWKPIGLYSGKAKQAHDFVHGKKEETEEVINKSNQVYMYNNDFQKSQAAKILSCYGGAIEETIKKSEEAAALQKAKDEDEMNGEEEKKEGEEDKEDKGKKKKEETKKSESDSVIDEPTGE